MPNASISWRGRSSRTAIPSAWRGCAAGSPSRLRDLMPFCRDSLVSIDVEMPRWDGDDGWLEDPLPGMGWPSEIDLRLSTRPSVYHLDRAAIAALGLEGDLLLGWRGGDAIAAELG